MKAADAPSPERQELKPFLDHLEDFRRMLIRCAIALGLGMLLAVPLIPRLLEFLKAPLKGIVPDPDTFLRSMEVAGAFTAAMQIAFWSGLLVSAPFLLLFIGAFILPALKQSEQRAVFKSGGFAILLFVGGVALGYHYTLPFALSAMLAMHTWMGIQAQWTLTSYVVFTTQLLIAFGIAFELPVVLLALGRLGIVTSAQLRDKRSFAIIAILIIGAALTPPDVFSQLIMSVPLYVLYEACVWIIWMWERKRSSNATYSTPEQPVVGPGVGD